MEEIKEIKEELRDYSQARQSDARNRDNTSSDQEYEEMLCKYHAQERQRNSENAFKICKRRLCWTYHEISWVEGVSIG